jgi:formylmethanofuran dehydrogenase subunit E
MGIAGLAAVGIEPPVEKTIGVVIVETDGCFVDGIEVATGASIGHRTLRMHDFGKIAATFVDGRADRAVRVAPQHNVRTRACVYAPADAESYSAQLRGYQVMPENELFFFQEVHLGPSLRTLLSTPDARARCNSCGEEIINEREVVVHGSTLCRACAGGAYYASTAAAVALRTPESRAFP